MTDHLRHTRPTTATERPKSLPVLYPDDFVKAKYSHGNKRCYTARMMDIFLDEEHPYVAAYKEFRLATMDYLYRNHGDDHASNAVERAACWNSVGAQLGYTMVHKNFSSRAEVPHAE